MCTENKVQKHERCSIWNQIGIEMQIMKCKFNNFCWIKDDRISGKKSHFKPIFVLNICFCIKAKLSHTILALECKLNETDVVDKAPLSDNEHDNLLELLEWK